MIDVKKVGAFISECRKEHEWTQKQLGEMLGVTDRAVSKWETGRSLPDISLIEPLCGLFGISVSEILAGKRIEAEEYKRETDELLINAIGEHQLYGFQIVIHLLAAIALLVFSIPLLIRRETQWLPGLETENLLCWMAAAVLTGIIWYLDKNLPARKYRTSNVWIEAAGGAVLFSILLGIDFYVSGGGRALEQVTAVEKLWAAVLAAAGLMFTVGVRIFGCRTRKLK